MFYEQINNTISTHFCSKYQKHYLYNSKLVSTSVDMYSSKEQSIDAFKLNNIKWRV